MLLKTSGLESLESTRLGCLFCIPPRETKTFSVSSFSIYFLKYSLTSSLSVAYQLNIKKKKKKAMLLQKPYK